MPKDRRDAKYIQVPALMQGAIDLKPLRSNSEVYINRDMDVTNLVAFMNKAKEEGKHYTYFHAFLAAIAKTIYNRPKLNQFIKDRHLYMLNKISLSFVAKITLNDASEELMFILDVDDNDNIETISQKISDKVDSLRNKKNTDKKGANDTADGLAKLPNFIRVPVFGIIKFLDRKDLLPASITDNNIYYSSMIVSNLGSIGCGAIYHNLADFGTASSLATMGTIQPKKIINKEGKEEVRQFCEMGITLDERIGDGFYFSKSCKMIEHILNNPEMLYEPVNTKIEI